MPRSQDTTPEERPPGPTSPAARSARSLLTSRSARAWVLALCWAAMVWILGGDEFSARSTAAFLRPIAEWFVDDFSTRDMYFLLLTLRKSAHMAVYGLLALLILRALWIGSRRSLVTSLGLTVALVAVLALADETRQGYSSVRNGSAFDVALDLAGAAVVIAALLGLQGKRRRPLFAGAATVDFASDPPQGHAGEPGAP